MSDFFFGETSDGEGATSPARTDRSASGSVGAFVSTSRDETSALLLGFSPASSLSSESSTAGSLGLSAVDCDCLVASAGVCVFVGSVRVSSSMTAAASLSTLPCAGRPSSSSRNPAIWPPDLAPLVSEPLVRSRSTRSRNFCSRVCLGWLTRSMCLPRLASNCSICWIVSSSILAASIDVRSRCTRSSSMVPSSTTRPPNMMVTRSQTSSTSASRCEQSRMVMPRSLRRMIRSFIWRVPMGSIPAVGSSRIRSCG